MNWWLLQQFTSSRLLLWWLLSAVDKIFILKELPDKDVDVVIAPGLPMISAGVLTQKSSVWLTEVWLSLHGLHIMGKAAAKGTKQRRWVLASPPWGAAYSILMAMKVQPSPWEPKDLCAPKRRPRKSQSCIWQQMEHTSFYMSSSHLRSAAADRAESY